jgi:L-alanine-DL-glutamate epimerase-like enolase superfamily enzyme
MHGGYNRQGSGVNAIENVLWDLCGQAYGVPIYQLLGGKFRDEMMTENRIHRAMCYARATLFSISRLASGAVRTGEYV